MYSGLNKLLGSVSENLTLDLNGYYLENFAYKYPSTAAQFWVRPITLLATAPTIVVCVADLAGRIAIGALLLIPFLVALTSNSHNATEFRKEFTTHFIISNLYNVVILAFTPIVVVSEIFNGIYRNHSRSAILKHLPELKNYGVITRSRVFMKLLCDNNESAAFRAFKEITGMKPIVHHGLHQSPNTCGPAATIPQGENTAPLQGTIVSNPEPPPLWNNYQLPTYRSCAQVPTFIPKDQEFSSASSSRKPSNANQTSTKRRPVLVTLGTQLGTNWTRSWLAPTPLNQRQQQTPPLHNLSSRRSPFDDHDW